MPDLEKLQRETPGNPNFDRSLEVPVFDGELFQWQKGLRAYTCTGRLNIKDFPKQGFYIVSGRTGRKVRFIVDGLTNEANEFFDGEAKAYVSDDGFVKVQIWIGDNV